MNKNQIKDEMPLAALTVGQAKELLKGISLMSQKEPESRSDEVIGLVEVVKITGYTKATIYKFINQRQMPFHKPAHGGRKLFFKRSEINSWMEHTYIQTNDEFVQEFSLSRHNEHRHKKVEIIQARIKSLKTILTLIKTISNYEKENRNGEK